MRRPLSIFAAVWIITALLCNVFAMDLWKLMFFFALPVRWGLIAMGVIIALVALRTSMPDREYRRSARVALAIVLSGLALVLGFREYLSQDVRFLLSRAHYERRLEEVLSGKGADSEDVAGIERGTTTQVAFYWMRGVTDNWVGLVYDPSGEVLNVASARDLFDGDMTHSRHLTGPWYICWFT